MIDRSILFPRFAIQELCCFFPNVDLWFITKYVTVLSQSEHAGKESKIQLLKPQPYTIMLQRWSLVGEGYVYCVISKIVCSVAMDQLSCLMAGFSFE